MRKKHECSIYDIAQLAGVSPSTVSRALHYDYRISGKTSGKILDIAHELGYLKRDTRPAVAVILPHCQLSHYSTSMLNALQEELNSAGINWEIFDRNNMKLIRERAINGIISLDFGNPELGQSDFVFNVPIVVVNENCSAMNNVHAVYSDARQGVKTALDHLIKCGHRNIAYIYPATTTMEPEWIDPDMPLAETDNFSSARRLNAFRDIAAANKDITCCSCGFFRREINHANVESVCRKLMDSGITAVLVEGESFGVHFFAALLSSGIGIPEELSVCGWDAETISACLPVPMTAIGQDYKTLADACIDILRRQWAGENGLLVRQIPYRHFLRDSVSSPRALAEER